MQLPWQILRGYFILKLTESIKKKGNAQMTTPKNKHLTAEDRLIIHEFLNYGYSFSRISNRLGKSRTTVSREVLHHRFQKGSSKKTCEKTDKPPYVCNGCKDKINCRKLQFLYDAGVQKFYFKCTLLIYRAITLTNLKGILHS